MHPDAPDALPLLDSYLNAIYSATDRHNRTHACTFDPAPLAAGDDPASLPFRMPWAIITAWNPRSVARSSGENIAAHQQLIDRVRHCGLTFYPARSHARDNPDTWREDGILIEQIDLSFVVDLLTHFQQNAAVYAADGRAGLLFAASPPQWAVFPLRILQPPAPRR